LYFMGVAAFSGNSPLIDIGYTSDYTSRAPNFSCPEKVDYLWMMSSRLICGK
jgi:hypothetical protein